MLLQPVRPLRVKSALLGSLALCFGQANVIAQDTGFAEDFSINPIRYSVGSFDDSSGNFSIDKTNESIRLSATGTEAAPGSAYLLIQDSSDTFSADVQLDSTSTGNSAVFVEAILYSDTQNPTPDTNEGDIQVSLTASITGDGNMRADYCFSRRTASGDNVNLGDFGSEFCQQLQGATMFAGQTHKLGLALDRAARTLTVSVDETQKVVALSGDIYPAGSNFRRIQSWHCCELAGTSIVQVFGVNTQNFADDFSLVDPIFDRYMEPPNDRGRSVTVADGQARLSALSDGRGNNASLTPLVRTDYLEALVTLSSESQLAEGQQRVEARMDTIFYNDTANGSGNDDDRTGDVRGEILFIAEADGRRQAEYCLTRSNDADFDDRDRLLGNGSSCESFPMRIELDKAYRLSIELDRTIPAMIFRVDGFIETIQINTATFEPARARQEVGADANRFGEAVVYVDNLRTAPQALTASEVATGATEPAAFPAAPDLTSLQVDSTLPTSFDFSYTDTTLDFVDDFSGPSNYFGFWSGNANGGTRGESGVRYANNAIEMQTNSAVDNDDGNWTEFYINDSSDSLRARVSLSSSSRLPPDPDAEAQISIRATFLNDTQDGGFDGRDGDIESGITLRLRGDGRREINVDLRRRNADGSSESLNPYDIVELEPVDDLTPELDTIYEFGVAVDRDRQVLIFSVDDTSVEYQLGSQAFIPATERLLISTNHRGSSGAAIAYLHSVTTDGVDQNFAINPPAFAPYWPSWQGQQPGPTMEAIDGRLRLEADGTQSDGRGPFLAAHGLSDHVSAKIELSSETTVLPDGEGFVRVSGQLYNDTANGGNGENSIGDVFSEIRIEDRGDGERFVSYCAERVNNADFSGSSELLGGDLDNCPRMSIVPALDTTYQASITIDRVNATLTYRFAEESVIYNIVTGVFAPARTFAGVAVRVSEGSKLIAFADDLAFDPDPVPLEDSDNLLVDASDDISNMDGTAGPMGTDTTGNSSSGGFLGCSISGKSSGELHLLALLAAVVFYVRRRRPKRDVEILA